MMTDNEIKKALERCRDIVICQKVNTGGEFNAEIENITAITIGDALDLINRLEDKIEFLEEKLDNLEYEFDLIREEKQAVENRAIKEFAEKILKEIQDAILNNDKVKQERIERHNVDRYEDDFCIMCDGKIMALGGIRYFITQLLLEMGVE